MMEDFLTYSPLLALLASWGAIYALQRKASAKEKALQTVRRHWEAHLQSEQTLLREVLSDLVAFKRKIAEVKHQSSPETQHPAMQWNKLFGNDVALTAWNWTRFYQVIDVLHEGFRPWLDCTHPLLDDEERQLCCLLVLGFRNEELSVILEQGTATVLKRKTALRKKLGLPEKANLTAYLRSFANTPATP